VTYFADGILHHTYSKSQFADLGSSEKTVLVENGGHLISESVYLDCGLVALGNVVSTLTEPQWQHVPVPYMQSVLTRLLKVSKQNCCDMIMSNFHHLMVIILD
jgi:kinesin family protein 7